MEAKGGAGRACAVGGDDWARSGALLLTACGTVAGSGGTLLRLDGDSGRAGRAGRAGRGGGIDMRQFAGVCVGGERRREDMVVAREIGHARGVTFRRDVSARRRRKLHSGKRQRARVREK